MAYQARADISQFTPNPHWSPAKVAYKQSRPANIAKSPGRPNQVHASGGQ